VFLDEILTYHDEAEHYAQDLLQQDLA
jgi:hypothetical protein